MNETHTDEETEETNTSSDKEEGKTEEKTGGASDPETVGAEEGKKETTMDRAVVCSEESDIYCPHCGNGSAQQDDDPIVESNRIYLPMHCHMCESTWQCHFDLSGHTEINTPPEYAKVCKGCEEFFPEEEGTKYKYNELLWYCHDCHKTQVESVEATKYYAIYYQNLDETWDEEPRILSSEYLWDNDGTLMDTLDSLDDDSREAYIDVTLNYDTFTLVEDTSGYMHKIKLLTKEDYDKLKEK